MNNVQSTTSVSVTERSFGQTRDGKEVRYYEFSSINGMVVGIINYGGAVTKIIVPDRSGNFTDVVLGHDNIRGYEEMNDYFGAICGRYANRIGQGQFSIDGEFYQVPKNNNGNGLHGGVKGFDKRIWEGETFQDGDVAGVILTYKSVDGEEGYPGELSCKVTYSLTSKNEVKIDYWAETTKATVINLTNHTYFNLNDGGASDILDHELQIVSNHYTPVDEGLIPTGEIRDVEGGPFDFRVAKSVGKDIDNTDSQLKNGLGYDHNYVLDKQVGALSLVASVEDPESGRLLEILTTEPGLQFYSGNFLKGNITGKYQTTYGYRSGFCLETQHFPDSPNKPSFPSVRLEPGERFTSTTIYRFGTK